MQIDGALLPREKQRKHVCNKLYVLNRLEPFYSIIEWNEFYSDQFESVPNEVSDVTLKHVFDFEKSYEVFRMYPDISLQH